MLQAFGEVITADGFLFSQAGCYVVLGFCLALQGMVQHLVILDRKRHGDAQLPVLLHGALYGLIGV